MQSTVFSAGEESSMKGHEDDDKTGASLLWGEAARVETVQVAEGQKHRNILIP